METTEGRNKISLHQQTIETVVEERTYIKHIGNQKDNENLSK